MVFTRNVLCIEKCPTGFACIGLYVRRLFGGLPHRGTQYDTDDTFDVAVFEKMGNDRRKYAGIRFAFGSVFAQNARRNGGNIAKRRRVRSVRRVDIERLKLHHKRILTQILICVNIPNKESKSIEEKSEIFN